MLESNASATQEQWWRIKRVKALGMGREKWKSCLERADRGEKIHEECHTDAFLKPRPLILKSFKLLDFISVHSWSLTAAEIDCETTLR